MKRYKKKELLEMAGKLEKVNDVIQKSEVSGRLSMAETLEKCQQIAIEIGNSAEERGEAGAQIVSLLEVYCEDVYQLYLFLENDGESHRLTEKIQKELREVCNKIRYELPGDKKEIVFLPYKASMWDSLESIWMAAKEDEDANTYVIPVPYFDKNQDGSLGEMHDESDQYPDYVPVTSWKEYAIPERKPDMIFIHNPYDNMNYVTSVHPAFYSSKLKAYTNLLIYVPYFSTSGGMNEAQKMCEAYKHVDYIIIQAEKFRKYYDPSIPQKKLVVLGSPKFDRVIRKCENPPEPPENWKGKIKGKKVYFYNTSIGGMLGNTELFLNKMKYVFRCFEGRENACLLWRPHPLLESTFDSMRKSFKPEYDKLKAYFTEKQIGILDETPDMTDSIALSDAYIGDSLTSVTSLFGIVGKPLFILNNSIDCEPGEDDWKGEIIKITYANADTRWMITQGNQLYYSPQNDFHYKYYCSLSEYAYGNYYCYGITMGNKLYVCPKNAQNILMIEKNGVEKKIELKKVIENANAFWGGIGERKCIILMPRNYPALVRYNTITEKISYFNECFNLYHRYDKSGEERFGGWCTQNGYLFVASPVEDLIYCLHIDTEKTQILKIKGENKKGYGEIVSDGTDIWLLPYEGYVITRWNPKTGKVKEYNVKLEGLQCIHPVYHYICEKLPFNTIAFCGKYVYCSPGWSNKGIRLNRDTGEVNLWDVPFTQEEKNGYYEPFGKYYFLPKIKSVNDKIHNIYSVSDKKLYELNLETEKYKEIPIIFDKEEVLKYEPGFSENSQWMPYCCQENAFNSLPNFLDGEITGNMFNKERQIKAFGVIAENHDGTCGQKVYEYMCRKMPVT